MPQNEFDESHQEISSSQSSPHFVNKSQKLAVVVLAFFAFLTIGMWSFQFKKRILISTQSGTGTNVNQILDINSAKQTENDLHNKDTDEDGLSDWDELNTYKTSPYLEDSDSDGFSDKVEIDSNNDPNCPVGRDCYTNTIIKNDVSNSLDNSKVEPVLKQEGLKTEEIKGLEQTLYQDGDVTKLRQMLVDNGMDKSLLDQVSDTELLNLFRETVEGK